MNRIYFTKLFLDGALKGLTYHDSVTGPDAAKLAKTWRIGRTFKPYAGSSYRIVDASFQKYAR